MPSKRKTAQGNAARKQRVEELPGGIYPLIEYGNGGNAGTGVAKVGSGLTRIASGFDLCEYIGEHGFLHRSSGDHKREKRGTLTFHEENGQ
jgi:hypothetical protein